MAEHVRHIADPGCQPQAKDSSPFMASALPSCRHRRFH
ncbi:Hypothetical protein CAP_5511 [Chondromyces apiculatus DSM 436]|uniref:Uncharacterized protein n=1 Tax=Chondromyces apiculatus DSM 436 TaxID=1192034 RepID=A0A017T3H3_9BACT|nr:Hypothetical protein CAP_5511 [Chondromyces apiculatus DSM 436]